MALFRFRARNPFRVRSVQRDGETDAARLARLLVLLDDLRREITRERDGLRDRHQSVAARAAFSQQALEDDQADSMSPVIDDLTMAMMRYTTRIATLEQQIDFVTGLRDQATAFPHENEAVGADEAIRGRRLA